MKLAIVMTICVAVAGCSSTTESRQTAQTSVKAQPKSPRQQATRKQVSADACTDAMTAQNNAATVGAMLGFAGGFGGFGGRGGMVASHVASTAGNAITAAEMNKARSAVVEKCY